MKYISPFHSYMYLRNFQLYSIFYIDLDFRILSVDLNERPNNVVRVDGISSCLFSNNLSDIWSRIRKRYTGWGYCRAFFTFSTRGQLPLIFQDSNRAFCLSCNLQHFAPLTMYFIYRQHISQNLILILTFQWCFTLFV